MIEYFKKHLKEVIGGAVAIILLVGSIWSTVLSYSVSNRLREVTNNIEDLGDKVSATNAALNQYATEQARIGETVTRIEDGYSKLDSTARRIAGAVDILSTGYTGISQTMAGFTGYFDAVISTNADIGGLIQEALGIMGKR